MYLSRDTATNGYSKESCMTWGGCWQCIPEGTPAPPVEGAGLSLRVSTHAQVPSDCTELLGILMMCIGLRTWHRALSCILNPHKKRYLGVNRGGSHGPRTCSLNYSEIVPFRSGTRKRQVLPRLFCCSWKGENSVKIIVLFTVVTITFLTALWLPSHRDTKLHEN